MPTNNTEYVKSTRRILVGIVVVETIVTTLATMGRATSLLAAAMVGSYVIWATRSEWPPAERVLGLYSVAVLVQCAHLIEEYKTGFFTAFPPVFGAEPWSAQRFLTFNLVWLVLFVMAGFGLARGNRISYLVATFLAVGGGIGNGLGHLALSARQGGYFPGAYTGALALVVGSVLVYRLVRKPARVATVV